MAKKKWMKEAKAEHAGKSTSEFAHEHEHDKGKVGKQARLAEVGMKAHHASPAKMMNSFYGKKG